MEEWKDIEGYEGLYQISNLGRVKSLKRQIKRKNGVIYCTNEKILKGSNNGLNYFKVQLRDKNSNKKYAYIHRLVAKHFIPNPQNKPCINHLDCNPSNNRVENLEWCTKKENTDYMIKLNRNERNEQWLKKLNKSLDKYRKAVVGTSKNTGEKIHFISIGSTKKSGFRPGDVCKCCKGERLTAGGFYWEYD